MCSERKTVVILKNDQIYRFCVKFDRSIVKDRNNSEILLNFFMIVLILTSNLDKTKHDLTFDNNSVRVIYRSNVKLHRFRNLQKFSTSLEVHPVACDAQKSCITLVINS